MLPGHPCKVNESGRNRAKVKCHRSDGPGGGGGGSRPRTGRRRRRQPPPGRGSAQPWPLSVGRRRGRRRTRAAASSRRADTLHSLCRQPPPPRRPRRTACRTLRVDRRKAFTFSPHSIILRQKSKALYAPAAAAPTPSLHQVPPNTFTAPRKFKKSHTPPPSPPQITNENCTADTCDA
ncbi:serine/arginine-rich splicing factor 2 [Tribolium castaneum]|uniref:serine/arginine-rich splicing factor 2 n=1 Tax=Tribolium castaneum TaxID=7070 RepID=UPI00046C2094|nr:PREDICTED: serine/arginine-rich splicing factor 2 [Tribolium castaneum]|eukprot:XP_008192995.1 PREDICTED: serine/arginine-rich splicing factor 2 [Tribolium castaneum]